MFSVLVLEQDAQLADQLASMLNERKYFVTVCHQLSQSYQHLEKRTFDIVITAHELSDGPGIELVEYLQHFAFQTRSMILAKGTTYHDRIAAYKKGADDFIIKPFNMNEFWWRLQTLCHRRKVFARDQIPLCDGVSVYPRESVLQIKNTSVTMPKRESQILTCLLNHRTRVVGRDELTRWVWQEGEFVPKDITLDVYIKRIRMKLGEYSSQLETVRGVGYRIREQV